MDESAVVVLSDDSNSCADVEIHEIGRSLAYLPANHNLSSSDDDSDSLPAVVIHKPSINKLTGKPPPVKGTSISLDKPPAVKVKSISSTSKSDISPGKFSKSAYATRIKNGEYLKCIQVVVAPQMLENPWWNTLESKMREDEVDYNIDTTLGCASMTWLRLTMAQMANFEQTENYLLIRNSEDVAKLIKAKNLILDMKDVIRKLIKNDTKPQITLVLFGFKEYFRKSKKRSKHSSSTNETVLNENELEIAITGLMLRLQISAVRVESADDLIQFVMHCNRSVAEGPHKKMKYHYEDQSGVLRGETKSSIKVDSSGKGLLRVWQEALSRLPGLGQNAARELARAFPSPLALRDASEAEIANLLVQGRRVGVEQARRLHSYLNETNGNVLLA